MSIAAPVRAVVLLGHGSRGTAEARPFKFLCRWLEGARPGLRCEDAYLSLCPPTLAATVDVLAADGVTELDILPLFLVEGHHIRQDLPVVIGACAAKHPDLRIRLSPTLAADAAVLGLLLERLEQALPWAGQRGVEVRNLVEVGEG